MNTLLYSVVSDLLLTNTPTIRKPPGELKPNPQNSQPYPIKEAESQLLQPLILTLLFRRFTIFQMIRSLENFHTSYTQISGSSLPQFNEEDSVVNTFSACLKTTVKPIA